MGAEMNGGDIGSKPLSDKACFTDKTLKFYQPPVAKGGVGDHRKPCPSVLASEGYIRSTIENTSGPETVSDGTDKLNEASENRCYTEFLAAGPPNGACVGTEDEIPRWGGGSVIKYIVRTNTFPKEHAAHAAKSFDEAVKEWNKKLGGVGPRFERTYTSWNAVFEVEYKAEADCKRDLFARSFFPGSEDPVVYVYPKILEDSHRDSMVNVFYHELGHVIGLRHEFAQEREKEDPCVLIGDRNEHSVMNYFRDPSKYRIHDLDVVYVKELYNLKESTYRGFRIADKVPQPLNSWSGNSGGTAKRRRVRSCGNIPL